jgi:hypothetical protein
MAHEFIIESQTFGSIKARHLARGRLYTFRIVEGKQGRRILKGTYPCQVFRGLREGYGLRRVRGQEGGSDRLRGGQ